MKATLKALYVMAVLQTCQLVAASAADDPTSNAPAFAPAAPAPSSDVTVGAAAAIVLVGPAPTSTEEAVGTLLQGIVSEAAQGDAGELTNPVNVINGLKAVLDPIGTINSIANQK